MKKLIIGVILLIMGCCFLLLRFDPGSKPNSDFHDRTTTVSQVRVQGNFGQLPLRFEANLGQTKDQVRFLARGSGYTLYLTQDEAVLALRSGLKNGKEATLHDKKTELETSLRMKLVGANPEAKISGLQQLTGKSNYLIGNNPEKWHTNVPNYAKIKYEDVYPGVDLIYYGNQRQLVYDLVVSPGVDPEVITLDLQGANNLVIDEEGDLTLLADAGEITFQAPEIYQEIDGVRQSVSGRYTLSDDQQVTFELDTYDVTEPLVIDPTVLYSTYLAGDDDDLIYAIAVDKEGCAYVTGTTASLYDFPTTEGVFQPDLNEGPNWWGGFYDAFVTKFNSEGTDLVYCTYIGGRADEEGRGIAVDADGNAHITGITWSQWYPTTENAVQRKSPGGWTDDPELQDLGGDCFVTKLNLTGSDLVYSTYLGSGAGTDFGADIALDSEGNAYVTGYTLFYNYPPGQEDKKFPITAGSYQTVAPDWSDNAFVAKFNPQGGLVYSTYLRQGDESYSIGTGVAADANGNAYVTGIGDFPATEGAYDNSKSYKDILVTKLNPSGSALVYSARLGPAVGWRPWNQYRYKGSSGDVAVDAEGNAYVTGMVSDDFATTQGAFKPTGDGDDYFMTKLNADGNQLLYSTFIGGVFAGYAANYYSTGGIALDAQGNAYVTGATDDSQEFIVKDAEDIQDSYGGGYSDAFVVKIDPTQEGNASLIYSSYLGGNDNDVGRGIAVDAGGHAYVAGDTWSTDFPTTEGAFDTDVDDNGLPNSFVSKIGIKWDMVPDGVAYDVLHWEPDVGPLQSSFPTIEITGTGLGDVDNVVFKLPDGKDDPYMIASNIQASDNKVEFELAVVHYAQLGERDIILKVKNKPDINATDKIGRKFFVTRIKVFFNQAVNTSSLPTHAHRDILIAGKKGAVRIEWDDESQLGPQLQLQRRFMGGLTVDASGTIYNSPQEYYYQASYDDDEIIEGRDYLSIPFPENLSAGEHVFSLAMIRDGTSLISGPLIRQRFVKSEHLDIFALRYRAKKADGTVLQPPTDADLKDVEELLKLVYPLTEDEFSYTDLGFKWDLPEKIQLEQSTWLGNSVTHLNEDGLNKLARMAGEILNGLNEIFPINVLVVYLPDNLLLRDINNNGIIESDQGEAAAGIAFAQYKVVFVAKSNDWGKTLAHEVGHVIEDALLATSELPPALDSGNLGDEYEGGGFYCDINPPVVENKGWVDVKKDASCANSPYVSGVNGDTRGIWASRSAFDPVHMKPKFYWKANTKHIRNYNFMAGGWYDDSTWVSVRVYDELMKVLVPAAATPSYFLASGMGSSTQKIQVSGIIYDDDRANFDNFDIVTSGGTTRPSSGPYSLELQDAGGATLASHQFDVNFVEMSEPPILTDHAFFNVRMELPVGTKRVVLKKDNIELASRSLSDNPPVVQITSPQEGESVSGEVELRWTGSDSDNDSLNYSIFFSPEVNVVLPIDALLTQNSYRLDLSEFPPTASASITVIGYDGLNNGKATVTMQIEEPVSVEEEFGELPEGFRLHQNYPNPFNPETRIRYDLPRSTHVRVDIFNVLGQKIRTLVDEQKPAGAHTVVWDGRNDNGEQATTGVYIYRLKTEEFQKSRKLLLLR